jgi:hypothetical protein
VNTNSVIAFIKSRAIPIAVVCLIGYTVAGFSFFWNHEGAIPGKWGDFWNPVVTIGMIVLILHQIKSSNEQSQAQLCKLQEQTKEMQEQTKEMQEQTKWQKRELRQQRLNILSDALKSLKVGEHVGLNAVLFLFKEPSFWTETDDEDVGALGIEAIQDETADEKKWPDKRSIVHSVIALVNQMEDQARWILQTKDNEEKKDLIRYYFAICRGVIDVFGSPYKSWVSSQNCNISLAHEMESSFKSKTAIQELLDEAKSLQLIPPNNMGLGICG